jgi:hypothetical protein
MTTVAAKTTVKTEQVMSDLGIFVTTKVPLSKIENGTKTVLASYLKDGEVKYHANEYQGKITYSVQFTSKTGNTFVYIPVEHMNRLADEGRIVEKDGFLLVEAAFMMKPDSVEGAVPTQRRFGNPGVQNNQSTIDQDSTNF